MIQVKYYNFMIRGKYFEAQMVDVIMKIMKY